MSKDSSFKIPSLEEIEKRKLERRQLPVFNRPPTTSNEPSTSTSAIASPSTSTAASTPTSTSTPPSDSRNSTPPSTVRKVQSSSNTILVNPSQQKNPILKHIHNVAWEPSETIKVDYVVGQTTGVIYLSLRYHRLYPTYIYERLASVKHLYVARILLVHVDIENYHDALVEINRIAILSHFTLMLAWSLEEAGRYLETYKAFEHKPPDLIRERVEDDYLAKMTDGLTQIKSVNKTDVLTLMTTFGSLKKIAEASTDQLAMCPGFGEQKVRRVQQVWKQPFLVNKKK